MKWNAVAILTPVAAYYGVFLLWPLGLMVARSLEGNGQGYRTVRDDPLFLAVIRTTIEITLVATVATVALAWLCAFAAWRASPRVRSIIVGLVVVPLLVSILVKTFSWTVILQGNGVLDSMLGALGITEQSHSLLYTRFAVVLGMVQYLLPYAFLPIYAALRNIERRLELAAWSLGASGQQSFRLIILPLATPGLAASTLLVIVMAVGFFVTPALLGGANDAMIANLIEYYARQLVDFRAAAALGVLVMVGIGLSMVFYQRVSRGEQYARR